MEAEDKKILIVDMDEVLYEEWSPKIYCEFVGKEYKKGNRKHFLVQELFDDKKELDRFVKFVFSKRNIYDGVPLIDGAIEALKKLNKEYSIYICTDYLFKGYEYESEKLISFKIEVLKRDFPFINPSQYIFMRGKKLLHADIFIDDRYWNFGPHIGQRLLFTAVHNKDMTDKELREKELIRVNSWKEICERLL